MIRSLVLVVLLALGTPAQGQYWSRSWAASPVESAGERLELPEMRQVTLRQVIRLSSGGHAIRLRLSNEMSALPLTIDKVLVAIADDSGRIRPDTSRTVHFGGNVAAKLRPHAPLASDPIRLDVPAFSRIAISFYLEEGLASPTIHPRATATGWMAAGDQSASVELANSTPFFQRLILSAVDIESDSPHRTIVAFGDSITDGVEATLDADTRWPDLLARRLQMAGFDSVGVANAGIGGNRMLSDGRGPNALARFDRDALSVPGVSHILVLEGVNDLGGAWRDGDTAKLRAEDVIAAYRQMIARSRLHGVRIVFATILPFKGAGYWSEWGENLRQEINAWIRTNREADGFVDFDAAIRDPEDPERMAAAYDRGDALHPNDAGFRAMSDAIDLDLLRSEASPD